MPENDRPEVPAERQPASPQDDQAISSPESSAHSPPDVISAEGEVLPEEDTEEASVAVYSEYYQGPIPHPGTLRQYAEIIPDGANRILVMAEKQADHRREMERLDAEHQRQMERETLALQRQSFAAETKRSNLGLGAGLIVALAGFGLSYGSIIAGHPIVGSLFGASTLASLVGTFVYGTNARRAEQQQDALPPEPEDSGTRQQDEKQAEGGE